MDDLKILQQILNKLDKLDGIEKDIKNIKKDITNIKTDIKDIKANQSDIITEISSLYSISSDIQLELKKTNDKLDKVIELNDLKI